MRSPKPSLRRFISGGDVRRSATATSRRRLTGPRLVQHILAAADFERAMKASDRAAFAFFQLQEPQP